MTRILVFPCGSEIGLEVYRALNKIRNITLIGASSVNDHGKFVFENYIGNVPFIKDQDFIESIQKIVKDNQIDLIYPCMDNVIEILKKHEDKLGCDVISSNYNSCKICSSKKLTYEMLKDVIRTPKVYQKKEVKEYPVFSKPEIGASSRNTFKILDKLDLEYFTKKFPENLILEYLPGPEYTVDCFTNNKNELIFVSSRERTRITNGISANTKIIDDPAIIKIAKKINDVLYLSGAWFFQLKKDSNNQYCLLEVASRFGGSSVIQRYRGINFPLLNVYDKLGYDLEIEKNDFLVEIDRSFEVSAKVDCDFNNVYVDFDDTIIIDQKVNEEMIAVIYKFVNQKKKVILITKHEDDILSSLEKYKIEKTLFDEIIHIKKEDEKSSYIKTNSIFIDDSFSERKKVRKTLGIPTFSPDTVNCFL